jgi:hypothetical protein
LPHALRRVSPDEQTVTALGVLAGYDADLAAEATRLTNRLHDALLHVHPALERLLGRQFRRRGVLELLVAAGTPALLRALGEDGVRQAMMPGSPRTALTLPAQILSALDEQTVIVPATEQYGRVISGVAAQLLAVLDQRVTVAGELDALLADHPLAEVLTSMPGVGADRGRPATAPVAGASRPGLGTLAEERRRPTGRGSGGHPIGVRSPQATPKGRQSHPVGVTGRASAAADDAAQRGSPRPSGRRDLPGPGTIGPRPAPAACRGRWRCRRTGRSGDVGEPVLAVEADRSVLLVAGLQTQGVLDAAAAGVLDARL